MLGVYTYLIKLIRRLTAKQSIASCGPPFTNDALLTVRYIAVLMVI